MGADRDYDYGLVNISKSLNTGNFGISVLNNTNLKDKAIYNYGFPDDKSYGTMWYDSGKIGTLATRTFRHNADTSGGNSGGPVVLTNNYEYIVGIHASGYSSYNKATRVTSAVLSFVQENW